MDNTLNYNLQFVTNGNSVFQGLNSGLNAVNETTQKVTKSFGDCYKSLLAVELASQGISQLSQMLEEVIAPGIALNTQMADLSAITGLTGQGLKDIEIAARASAKTFGTDASQNVNSYKLILSQLSPEIAKSSEAMKLMGNNVNILSKTMGGDTVAATNVLTTAMNQYGVNLDNPIAASKVMADMMNVMAAGAKEGSAELPQIQAALEQVGMVAKTTGVSFVTTNAAIQMLDKAGKKGSEGGVALRNVLTTLSEGRFASKDATAGLQAMGISTLKLADASIPLTDRLRMLKPAMADTALMTKVFGKENMAASIALIQSADEQDELAQKITGTNTALEQANVVMGSYQERMNRWKAVLTDVKIGFFNATESFTPFVQAAFSGFNAIGELATAGNALYSIYESRLLPKLWDGIKAFYSGAIAKAADSRAILTNIGLKLRASIANARLSISQGITTGMMMAGAIASRIQSQGLLSVVKSMSMAAMAQIRLNLAMLANPVGLIIAGVVALIAVIAYVVYAFDGWGKAWDHTVKAAKLAFKGFVGTFELLWLKVKNSFLNGIDTIQLGWYKFKNAVGLGDESENNRMIAKINTDADARKKAIIDGQKKVKATMLSAGKEAVLAVNSVQSNGKGFGTIMSDIKASMGVDAKEPQAVEIVDGKEKFTTPPILPATAP
ncbi:phage tail tape measure protein, partial [Microcoleus sp. herbarium8]